MKKNTLMGLFSVATILLLCGCSTSKMHAWVDEDFKDRSLGKTAVLATFEDEYLSLEFEAVFAERLRDFVPAASLHAAIENIEERDKEDIEKLLKHNQIDTLIVTHRVGSANRSQLVPYGASYQTYAGTSGNCYTYCSSFQLDESVDSFIENSIETSVFDVKTGTLMWSGLREVYDFNPKTLNMKDVVNEVVWDLEANGMVRATKVY